MIEHWTDDELIEQIYGVGPGGEAERHLALCAGCQERLSAMAAVRGEMESRGVPDEFLREQRLKIHSRIELDRRLSVWLRPAPAVAAGLVLAVGLMWRSTPPAAGPETQGGGVVSDAQFFSEIASEVDRQGPRAAEPIHGLFREEGSE